MKLSLKEMAYVAGILEEKSPISLFTAIEASPDGSEPESLTEKGIIKDGKLDDVADLLFEVVAKAENAARIVVQDDKVIVERYVYRLGEKYVLVENDMGDLAFFPLFEIDKLAVQFTEYIGSGRLKGANVGFSATPTETLVLLSLIDAYRKNNLLHHGDGTKLKDQYDLKTIEDGLKGSVANSFAQIMINSYGYELPEKGEVAKILESLKEKALVEGKYRLEEELVELARRMLLPKVIVVMESFSLDEGGALIVDTSLAIQAGVKDILYINTADDINRVMSLSGFDLLHIIEDYLRCPELGPA